MSFLFPARLGRLSYFGRFVLFSLGTSPLAAFFDQEVGATFSINDLWLLLLGLALIGYWLVWIVRPRCKDAGMHWAWMFLMLVPLLNVVIGLILLFSRTKLVLEEKRPN